MSPISSVSQFLPVLAPAPVASSGRQAPSTFSRDDQAKAPSRPASSKAPGTGTVVDIRV
jgi:hypothetical protein